MSNCSINIPRREKLIQMLRLVIQHVLHDKVAQPVLRLLMMDGHGTVPKYHI